MGSIVEMTEDRTSELEDRSTKFTSSEKQRENRLGGNKTEQSLRDLRDSNKRPNISIIVPEVGERVQG